MTETGSKPWYLEECAATLAAAYSSGSGGGLEHEIVYMIITIRHNSNLCSRSIFLDYH